MSSPHHALGRVVTRISNGLLLALLTIVVIVAAVDDLSAAPTAIYTVNAVSGYDGTCDSSHCSIVEAIIAADNNIGLDTIQFNISGTGPFTISMGFVTIDDPVIIDGYTQPGASPATASFPAIIQIELIGTLDIVAGGSTVKGVAIHATNHVGIRLMTLGGNTIQGNYIGTDATGSIAKGYSAGVAISDSSNNTIGGTSPAERNIISGNGTDGINIYGSSSAGNVIVGNYIGIDPTGTMAVPNWNGVSFLWTSNNAVGGSTSAEANVISGNSNIGVLFTNGSVSNQAKGNVIGLDATGTAFLPNKSGVYVWGYQSFIGGTSQGEGNIIAGNTNHGIEVSSPFTGTTILYNQVFENGKLGIDLGSDGVTANDAGDSDTGANGLQNYPVLTEVSSFAGATTITGTLNSSANTQFWLQFFVNDRCDHTAYGEGELFVGDWSITTDGAGNAPFVATFGLPLPDGRLVTATSTNVATGETSEFSRCVQANQDIASANLTVNKRDLLDPSVAGALLVYLVEITNTGPFAATDVVLTDTLPMSVTFAAAIPSQGSCLHSGQQVICDLLILADGQMVNVEISVIPTATGTISNDVLVSSIEPDPDWSDNGNSEATVIVPSVPMTFTVNSADDNTDARPGDRLCEVRPGGGVCTLRAAIIEANYLPSDDTIILPANTYTLTISGNKEDASATGDLDITDDLSILGAGSATTIINANKLDRVFEICPGGKYSGQGTLPTIEVALTDLTVRGGNGGGESCDQYSCGVDAGGGIENWYCGDLTIGDSVIRNNSALNGSNSDQYSYPDGLGGGIINSGGSLTLTNTEVIYNLTGDGGGIYSSGPLTITNSSVTSNTAKSGGGIYSSGYISLTNTVVRGNVADNNGRMWRSGSGGGIYLSDSGYLVAESSVVSNNDARGVVANPYNAYLAHGGGIFNLGHLELRETTITSNTAAGKGGGALVYWGWIYSYRSLIAFNKPDGILNHGHLVKLENSTVTSNTWAAIESQGTWIAGTPPIAVQSVTQVDYSTLADNGSRGLDNRGYVEVAMRGTTLADHPGGNWVAGSVIGYSPSLTSHGHNLDDDGTTPFTHATDITNTNALLGSLQDNGGPTRTMAPLPGSPAIDAIPRASCLVNQDQRGFPRPVGAACDIGAYEAARLNICSTPVVPIPDNDPAGITDTINITYTDSVLDMDLFVEVTHAYVGDLKLALENVGTGTQVVLIDRPGVPGMSSSGCDRANISASLDDEAAAPVENECDAGNPTISGTFRPNEALSQFDGQGLDGAWRLTVIDAAAADTGVLERWCLMAEYQASSPTVVALTGFSALDGSGLQLPAVMVFVGMVALTLWLVPRRFGATRSS